jgi:hypothetical protein
MDFNNEGTMSKPPKDIVALIILEKLYNFIEADESYRKTRLQGASMNLAISRARFGSLYLIARELLKRKLSAEDLEKVRIVSVDLESKITYEDLIEAYIIILKILDQLGLVKLDTRPAYQRHRTEESNKIHGYA